MVSGVMRRVTVMLAGYNLHTSARAKGALLHQRAKKRTECREATILDAVCL